MNAEGIRSKPSDWRVQGVPIVPSLAPCSSHLPIGLVGKVGHVLQRARLGPEPPDGSRPGARAVFPFLLGRPHLADEGMEMAHQCLADVLDARIARVLDPLKHRVGDRGLVEVTHGCLRDQSLGSPSPDSRSRCLTVAMKSVSPSPCATSEP